MIANGVEISQMKKVEGRMKKNQKKMRFLTIVFPGHTTVSGMMVCSRLAGRAGWPEMKVYWQIDDGVTGKPAGPPDRP